MLKGKRVIYLIAFLIFILNIAKLLFAGVQLNSGFFVFEFLIYLIIVLLMFVVDFKLRMSKIEKKDLKEKFLNEIDSITKEKNNLLLKLEDYESRSLEEQKLVTYTSTVLQLIKEIFKSKVENKVDFSNSLFKVIGKNFQISGGLCYFYNTMTDSFECTGRYAIDSDVIIESFKVGDGLNGQVVEDGVLRVISDIPVDYLRLSSGLGESLPVYLYLLPIIKDKKVIGLLELSTFKSIRIDKMWDELNESFVSYLSDKN